MDANESFEIAAAAFCKATGYLMPGKDGCPRDENGDLTPEVARDFKVWCAAIDYMKKAAPQEKAREAERAVIEAEKRFEDAALDIRVARNLGHKVDDYTLNTLDQALEKVRSARRALYALAKGAK